MGNGGLNHIKKRIVGSGTTSHTAGFTSFDALFKRLLAENET
jgi:hypothetical protein